jgi:hypothetical protein
MPGHARRSRLVALGLSVGGLAGIVTGMVANERPTPEPVATSPTVTAPDPFTTGSPATPPSTPPTSRARRTITSAS